MTVYRIFDKDHDGKTKIDHLLEMLHKAVFKKRLPFWTVLMDVWYASMKVMKAIEHLSKIYYVPLKRNRLVNDTDGLQLHQQVRDLSWSQTEIRQGKRVHIKKFPKGHQVKLFRIASSNGRTEYIATNDLSQSDADTTEQEYRVRWKIEELHREIKQVTGIGKCQCRALRGQRNHIACCFQVWVCLKRAARAVGRTIYDFKDSLLDDYYDINSQILQ
ncbi:MAG: transposase [Candidatus Poribacteria bacterium]|nr:transposase [Candidatus Poribacteria bacterium]